MSYQRDPSSFSRIDPQPEDGRHNGSVANSERGMRRCALRLWKLCSDAENCMDELTLTNRITLSDPTDLPFSDCMHRFVALDRSACAVGRSKSEARRNPLLDEPVILLDDVVQIGRCSTATASSQFTGLPQLGDGVGRMTIHID